MTGKKEPRKNDAAWEVLFQRYNILETISKEGQYLITSEQINSIRESRLMAKFDVESSLPKIFVENKLSILPISRRKYIIGHFKTHFKLPEIKRYTKPRIIRLPPEVESLDGSSLHTEGLSLLYAFNAGAIQELVGEQARMVMMGRTTTGVFHFRIQNDMDLDKDYDITVENAQIEIDAGFETQNALIIVEAKNISVENFIARQLYYPYRVWEDKLGRTKEIIPMFMTFSDEVFTFYIFSTDEYNRYDSFKIERIEQFALESSVVTRKDALEVYDSITEVIQEPLVAFPQANRFERIIDLLILLRNKQLTKQDISMEFAFVLRQADYYILAARYLGLVEEYKQERTIYFKLTPDAIALMKCKPREKYLKLIKLILERPVFYQAFAMAKSGKMPKKKDVVSLIREHSKQKSTSKNKKSTTIPRRATTVIAWLNWIWKHTDEDE